MNQVTNVGLIGLGRIAQLIHLPLLKKINNVNVAAAAELNKSRLNSISDKFGIEKTYTDYKEMIDKENLDAIIIATPTNTHKDIAIDCIKRDKNILVEKPVARTYAETQEIFNLAKKHKTIVMVGMNMRYRPDVMLLKSILNSGDLGKIYYIKSSWFRKQSSDSKWFTKKEEAGGGVILDLGIVLLDLALWLLDFPEISSVSTSNFNLYTSTVEDSSFSFIRCKNSSLISIEASWSLAAEKDTFLLDVYGEKGFASLNPLKVFKKYDGHQMDLTPSRSENSGVLYKKSYLNEIKHFIGAVRGLNPLLSPLTEAVSRMKIIENMYNSAQMKKEVSF